MGKIKKRLIFLFAITLLFCNAIVSQTTPTRPIITVAGRVGSVFSREEFFNNPVIDILQNGSYKGARVSKFTLAFFSKGEDGGETIIGNKVNKNILKSAMEFNSIFIEGIYYINSDSIEIELPRHVIFKIK
jgi:hypothetical protein